MEARAAANSKTIARNKRATYNYEILERFEAGLALTGTEIKSIREGKASIAEAYAQRSPDTKPPAATTTSPCAIANCCCTAVRFASCRTALTRRV
jgi:hypothetical protein